MLKKFIQSIEITSLSKEDSFFMQLKLTFETGEIKHIKLQLDRFTYKHLRKVVFPNYLNQGNNNHICSIPVHPQNNNNQSESEWIVWDLFGQTSRFSFLCSKEYKLFLSKLRTVGSLEEFNEILIQKDEVPTLPIPKPTPHSLFKSLPISVFFIICLFVAWFTNFLSYLPNTSSIKESEMIMADVVPLEIEPISSISAEIEKAEVLIYQEMIKSLPEGQIALTFDDGPSTYTQEILAVLEKHSVHATFFFVGNNIERFPQAVIDTRDQGHGIGLHSFSHQVMRNLSSEQQDQDIKSCVQAIKPYVEEVFLFRPPYGLYDDNTKDTLLAHNMSLVLWNRDPEDWKAKSSQQIVDAVLNASPSGGIYILHENALTLKALPQIIEAIKEKDLEFMVLGNTISTTPQI